MKYGLPRRNTKPSLRPTYLDSASLQTGMRVYSLCAVLVVFIMGPFVALLHLPTIREASESGWVAVWVLLVTTLSTAYLLILFRFLFRFGLRYLRRAGSYGIFLKTITSSWVSTSVARDGPLMIRMRELIEVWHVDIDEIPDESMESMIIQDVTQQEVKNHVENMGMKYLYNDGNDFYGDDGVSGRYCPITPQRTGREVGLYYRPTEV